MITIIIVIYSVMIIVIVHAPANCHHYSRQQMTVTEYPEILIPTTSLYVFDRAMVHSPAVVG